MKLYLLRHGIAADPDPARFADDSLRPLDPRGEKQVGEIARAMHRMDLAIDTIWCSPFLRTRQTAAVVAARLGLDERVHARDALAPDGDAGELLAALALEPASNVLLVGHEPYLSRLLSVMASGGSALRTQIKKGGLARLDVTGPPGPHQCAVLQWLVPPRLLVQFGE